MKLPKNRPSERKLIKESSRKRRKSVLEEIYQLWKEEIEEKGFKKLSRLEQGLL